MTSTCVTNHVTITIAKRRQSTILSILVGSIHILLIPHKYSESRTPPQIVFLSQPEYPKAQSWFPYYLHYIPLQKHTLHPFTKVHQQQYADVHNWMLPSQLLHLHLQSIFLTHTYLPFIPGTCKVALLSINLLSIITPTP